MKKLLSHPLFISIFSLLAIFFLISLNKTAKKSKVSQKNVETLEGNIQRLVTKIEKEEHFLELANTQLAKEKIIRNELLMQKPGEYILQIPKEAVIEEESNALGIDANSNLNEWLKLLF